MTTKKIICLDCNKFIFDIEETPEHIHHNIHSEKTLYNHLINDDTINDRLVNLIEDMKNCVEAVNHIDSQINTIKVTFESIHNRLMVEEHALKKPLEEQLETIKESMKKMYDEIIHYWNLNQWINQNNSNSSEESISLKSSSDTSVSIQVVENEESNINNNSSSDESATTTPDTSIDFEKEQIKINNGYVYKSNHTSNDEDIDIVNMPIINVNNSEIISRRIFIKPDPFDLLEEIRSHNEMFDTEIGYEQPIFHIPVTKSELRDKLLKQVDLLFDNSITFEMDIPEEDSTESRTGEFTMFNKTFYMSANYKSDYLSIFLNTLRESISVKFKVVLFGEYSLYTKKTFDKSVTSWGWSNFIAKDKLNQLLEKYHSDTIKIEVIFKEVLEEIKNI